MSGKAAGITNHDFLEKGRLSEDDVESVAYKGEEADYNGQAHGQPPGPSF